MEPIDYENPQVFPRITLCNLRPLQSGSEPEDLRRDFQSVREEGTTCDETCTEYDQKILNIIKQQLNGILGMRQFYDLGLMEKIGHQEMPFIVSCSKMLYPDSGISMDEEIVLGDMIWSYNKAEL